MAGVRGKDRGKREKRPCLTGEKNETRKQIFRDKITTKEKNAQGAEMNQIWESRHVLTGVVNAGFDTMKRQSKVV